MTHGREDAPKRYPGPSFYDEALAWLREGRQDGEIHIPTFARRVLEQLRDVGLLHTTDAEPPANVRKVRLTKDDKVQDIWLRFDTIRDPRGYVTVEVVGSPRSDAAILAAMVAGATEPIDFKQVLLAMAAERSWEETWRSNPDRNNVRGGEVLLVLQSKTEAYLE